MLGREVAMQFPIEFRFSSKQKVLNSAVSKFLGTSVTETSDRPVYYFTKRVTYLGVVYKAVVLSLFYAENPGYYCKIGYHPADVEHVVILYDILTNEPKHVYFSAHGKGEGTWVPFDKCVKNEAGGLVVYVSPTSNAMYPKARIYWRLGGVVNDVCKDEVRWIPRPNDFQDAVSQSWSESHYQVAKGINSPKNISPPVEKSISDSDRFLFFLPCVRKKIQDQSRLEWL